MKTTTISFTQILEARNARIYIDENLFMEQLSNNLERRNTITSMLSVRWSYLFCLGYFKKDALSMKHREFEKHLTYLTKYDLNTVFSRYDHEVMRHILTQETDATFEEIEVFLKLEEALLKTAKANRV